MTHNGKRKRYAGLLTRSQAKRIARGGNPVASRYAAKLIAKRIAAETR